MKRGVTREQLAADLTRLSKDLPARFGGPPSYAQLIDQHSAVVEPILDRLIGPTARTSLWVLLGAAVAQVPHHTFSLWNNYQFHPRLGAGLGMLYRSDMWAAIDNTVTLPGYTRTDAAVYYFLGKNARLQANLENAFDKVYYLNADNNTNITPGYPRTIRVALTTTF